MEINICVGTNENGMNKDLLDIAKIEVESVDDYLQKRDLLSLVREKTNNPKAIINKTFFDNAIKKLYVFIRN